MFDRKMLVETTTMPLEGHPAEALQSSCPAGLTTSNLTCSSAWNMQYFGFIDAFSPNA